MAVNPSEREDFNIEVDKTEQSGAPETKERQLFAEQILEVVDFMIKTHLRFEKKENEGNQALIFRIDLATDVESLPEQEQRAIEDYIGSSKSIKVLKVTNREEIDREYDGHYEAYDAYERLTEEEKKIYASIPKPYTKRNIKIDSDVRQRLNDQNADLDSQEASVMLMEWVEGEDLYTKALRLYLKDRPGYAHKSEDPNADFSSLLFWVTQDFQSRGIDFYSLSTIEQYRKIFAAISKNGHELLTQEQKLQIRNTLKMLHTNGLHHNDLHMRNYMVENGTGKIYLIDFGRAGKTERVSEDDIKDEFLLNFVEEFKSAAKENEYIYKSIEADLARIRKMDKSFPRDYELVKKLHGTDLVNHLQRESNSWRLDVWALKKLVAIALDLESSDEPKANLIKEFIKEKKNYLNVEGQQVVNYLSK